MLWVNHTAQKECFSEQSLGKASQRMKGKSTGISGGGFERGVEEHDLSHD